MPADDPRVGLVIVLCGSLAVYVAVVAVFWPVLTTFPVTQREDLLNLLQVSFRLILLLLLFLLPASYMYWGRRISVRVLGPTPAAAEPGEQLTLTVVTGFPGGIPSKGALLEALLGPLTMAVQKLEGSPTQLTITVPPLPPGYHQLAVRVSKLGYFSGSDIFEFLVTPLGEDIP